MFKHDTRENRENLIEIVDCDFNVLTELIRFMYTGMVRNLENIAKDLLITADKYNTNKLKFLCENYISHNKSIENCIGLYLYAKLHSFTDLEDEMKMFVNQNIKDVISTAEFISMKQEHPDLMLDLLCHTIENDFL